jgi:hypothetical protein
VHTDARTQFITGETMKRTTATTLLPGAVFALAISITAIAATPSDDPAGPPTGESTVRVESAGADGAMPNRTAQVQSADYDTAPAELLPRSGMSMPLIAAISAAFLAIALFFGLRRRRPAPPV